MKNKPSLYKWLCTVGYCLVFMVTAATAGSFLTVQAFAQEQGLKVTVLIFSGRPDPTFSLTRDNEFQTVSSALEKAVENKSFRGETVIPSRLGYKGILVENISGVKGVPRSIAVRGRDIEIRNKHVLFLRDNGELERYLLEEAMKKGAIDKTLFREIRKNR